VGGCRYAIIISLVHQHHRSGGHVIALLIRRCDQAGFRVNPQVRPPKACCIRFDRSAISGYSRHGAIRLEKFS
jgi:hypothetical protein